MHTLPERFVKIRHYGILSNRNRKTKLKRCKKILGVSFGDLETTKESKNWEELLLKLTGVDLRICPCCEKGRMIRKIKLEPRCYSPPQFKSYIA